MTKQSRSDAYLFSFTYNGSVFPEDVCIIANSLARAVMMAEVYQEQYGHLSGSTVDHIRRIPVAGIMIDSEIYAAAD